MDENSEIISSNFDINKHNDMVLENKYNQYKDYFLNMYKGIDDNIILDKEQIRAILSEEDYALILAGAGTGKTTTMVSLVKYLVDIKKVEPSRICVMSFSRKTTEELQNRINIDFLIPCRVSTFHSLGYSYIKEIYKNRKCYVVDENKKNEIFMKYFMEYVFPYKDKIKLILDNFEMDKIGRGYKRGRFIFKKYFIENFNKYDNFFDYFEDYKKIKLREAKEVGLREKIKDKILNNINLDTPMTINNEMVKSKGEALIANFLYCNGIEYEYEKIYKDLLDNNSIYRPDFTLNLNGDLVYLEYFGLSDDKKMNKRYEYIKKKKEGYHKRKHNKFISLSYMDEDKMLNTLKEELLKLGFKLNPKSDEEIYLKILDNNPTSQLYEFKDFLYDIISKIKSSLKRDNYYNLSIDYINRMNHFEKKQANIQFEIINEFYNFYQRSLYNALEYGFDYSDMIFYANKYIDNVDDDKFKFKYLIIDEYQDISMERYNFSKNIIDRNNSRIVAVGDDWQSIYSFTGSNIDYTYNFLKYFKGAKLLRISKTYRNSQELIDYSSSFVLKNKKQIVKDLISDKKIDDPIKFCYFDDGYEYEELKRVILEIHEKNPDDRILILGRKNDTIKKCYEDGTLIDDVGTKVSFFGYDDISIDAMTIHKSKGLTSDQVILIGLDRNFPHDKYEKFWMEDIFSFKFNNEGIEYPEERRLFYVALTRTKNYVYMLVNSDPRYRSPYIKELSDIIYNIKREIGLKELYQLMDNR